jgi:hypothetical protein
MLTDPFNVEFMSARISGGRMFCYQCLDINHSKRGEGMEKKLEQIFEPYKRENVNG